MSPRWQQIRGLVGLLALGAIVFFVGAGGLTAHVMAMDWRWLALAATCIASSTLLGGFILQTLMVGEACASRFGPFLIVYWGAWALGLVVPGGLGDMAAVAAWLRRRGAEWHSGLGRSILDKLITLAWMLALAAWGLAGGLWNTMAGFLQMHSGWVAVFLGVGLVLLLVALLASPGQRALGLVARTLAVVAGLVRLYPARVLLNILLTPVKILLLGLSYWCTFNGLGAHTLDPGQVVLLVAAIGLVAYVPVSFNGLGTVEAAGLLIFGTLGLSAPMVLSAYLIQRLLVLLLAWVPTGAWLLFTQR